MKSHFEPKLIEKEIYQAWESRGLFKSKGDGNSYCIVLPPPNITGSLHMGHAFQVTLMDMLIRHKRLHGLKTLWQGGTDHAGIATQMVIERKLEAEGISKDEIGREAFLEKIWEWKEFSGGTISKQLRRMGASIDWSREKFTLEAELSEAVKEVFVTLYDEKLIYRGKRLVNWDPVIKTAVSDLEVRSQEEKGHLWFIKYDVSLKNESIIIATTRPETMLGDTAIAINPDDERFSHLIGGKALVPITKREIPIIGDNYVDMEFGTGCLKVTPAHDFNDFELGKKHSLDFINIFDESGQINTNCPKQFQGLDRFVAREKIITELKKENRLIKQIDHSLKVPRGERTGAIIEPFLTEQWFVRVESLAKPAIDAVKNGQIKFTPKNWERTYYRWMEDIEDWCISRQLWWGHQIPAWYDQKGNIYVGKNEETARRRSGIENDDSIKLTQDPDVLDTWFSSALWPFTTLGWPKKTKQFKEMYPTDVLVTGFDIIFFWVARMIMMGLKFTNQVPFKDVYIHGLVRDSEGNKMSKSKGNILDPLDLIDGIDLENLIKKRTSSLMNPKAEDKIKIDTIKEFPNGIPAYGTDALRMTFAAMATQGRDIRFDLGRIGGYRNFCNKIWNATKFVLSITDKIEIADCDDPQVLPVERWINFELSILKFEYNRHLNNYRFDLAANIIYEFIWEKYCDWYIEISKIFLYHEKTSEKTKQMIAANLLTTLQDALIILHPIMPFITEELWSNLEKTKGSTKNFSDIKLQEPSKPLEQTSEISNIRGLIEFISEVRRLRTSLKAKPDQKINVYINNKQKLEYLSYHNNTLIIKKLVNAEKIIFERPENEDNKISGLFNDELFFIELDIKISYEEALSRLIKTKADLEPQIEKCSNKMKNREFLEKAPKAVVEKEKNKLIKLNEALEKTEEQLENIQHRVFNN